MAFIVSKTEDGTESLSSGGHGSISSASIMNLLEERTRGFANLFSGVPPTSASPDAFGIPVKMDRSSRLNHSTRSSLDECSVSGNTASGLRRMTVGTMRSVFDEVNTFSLFDWVIVTVQRVKLDACVDEWHADPPHDLAEPGKRLKGSVHVHQWNRQEQGFFDV